MMRIIIKENIMQKAVSYIEKVGLVVLGFLVLFVGIGAIVVVLKGATWDQLGDWSLKALYVALIFFVLNAVGAFISAALSGDKK